MAPMHVAVTGGIIVCTVMVLPGSAYGNKKKSGENFLGRWQLSLCNLYQFITLQCSFL